MIEYKASIPTRASIALRHGQDGPKREATVNIKLRPEPVSSGNVAGDLPQFKPSQMVCMQKGELGPDAQPEQDKGGCWRYKTGRYV